MNTNADLFGGKYTVEEVERIMNINARPSMLKKPFNPVFKKSATEHAPTWEEKREVSFSLVHPYFIFLINCLSLVLVCAFLD